MSIIPTTFNETLPSYTVVGGKERLGETGLSAVLLNRGGRYARRNIFHDLEKTGFDTVVSVEPEPAHYDIDELSFRFPFVRFVLIRGTISLGDQINLAASELDSPLFFVLWNDLKMIAGGNARRMAERLVSSADDEQKSQYRRLCTVPVIQNSRFDTLPTLIAPDLRRKKARPLFISPTCEGLPSLYPFDGVGIYDRDRFIKLGGFDGMIGNSLWQLMDFGFRAYLWGEEISSTQTLRLSYEAGFPAVNESPDPDYCRFYLKNLAPAFRRDYAYLPLRRFLGYLFQTTGGLSAAWDDFSECRLWVQKNQFRWHCDPKALAERWNLDTAMENLPPENEE
ncbi:MAG: hypothetical protein LBQ69_01960 [Treponema sp.]|jgi:hypothetical protein|nr:hypothetical protein [Treponema sp.]